MVDINRVIDDSYGGKAYGLSILYRNGLAIPPTFCISPFDCIDDLDEKQFYEEVKELEKDGYYNVAVRSSSMVEDSFSESKAGLYLTRIGRFTFEEMIEAVKDVFRSGEHMGIIIQQAIDSDYSGVFFSSNPITYSKKTGVLSYVQGMGEILVGGDGGHDVEIQFDRYNGPFAEVVSSVKELEHKLGYPIDVEWCMEKGKIWYLQCRPITSISAVKSGFYKVDKYLDHLPSQLISHDKIKLRFEAQKTNAFISDAYIHVKNHIDNQEAIEDIKQSQFYCGYSVVIIYPQRVYDKVVRAFIGSNFNFLQSARPNEHFEIQSYPKYYGLSECLTVFHNMANDYWISVAIVQEIFDAKYTGIIQKTGGGYLIEITKGHFLTKGNALTSQYYVENKKVKERIEINQHSWYAIAHGHIILYKCEDENNSLVSLKDRELMDIIESFSHIIESGNRVVEFGMLKGQNGLVPYLIDFVEAKEGNIINLGQLKEGIISCGKRCGRIVRIDQHEDLWDKHFHDKEELGEEISEDIIFLSRTPSISLLDILKEYDNSRIAFAFEEGSFLCHFAVVLREKGIPAAKVGNLDRVGDGWYSLDAETVGLARERRLVKLESKNSKTN